MNTHTQDKQISISGYQVSICFFDDQGETRSSCHIQKGKDANSLECVEEYGAFDFGDGPSVPQRVIDAARAWAFAQGYDAD